MSAPLGRKCRKRRFKSDTEARAVLAITQLRKANGKQGRREKAYYFCYACKAWHLTSQGEGNKTPSVSEHQRKARALAAKNKKGKKNGSR